MTTPTAVPYRDFESDFDPLFRYGRTAERARLDQLLREVSAGHAAALRIIGDAGIGKTALLEYAARRAGGYHVIRVRGTPGEREFPYAGLHLLCSPLIEHVNALPDGQRRALTTAVGLRDGEPPDRFLVSLAVSNLFTRLAARRPVCLIIDDAHWLDHASTLVLGFVARRAGPRPLLVLLGELTEERRPELDDLREMLLAPLGDADARALLAAVAPGKVDAAVAERILLEARGRPRLLIDAFDGVTAAEFCGGYAIPRSGKYKVDRDIRRRAAQLPPDARRLLLAAAADQTGNPPLIWRAAAALDADASAAEVLEAQGLLHFGPRVAFTSPQLRAAAYEGASATERRAVHQALARATRDAADADRRAWHVAQATTGLDDDVAARLEEQAATARARGGTAAQAAFLEKAALLTADPVARARRALAAADAKCASGAPDAAKRLLAIADAAPPDAVRQAQVALQAARIALTTHRDKAAYRKLIDAARRMEPHSFELARDAYLEALVAAPSAGQLAAGAVSVTATLAARDAQDAGTPGPADLLLRGLATRVLDGYTASVDTLRQAVAAFDQGEADGSGGSWRSLAAGVAADLWDERAWSRLSCLPEHPGGGSDRPVTGASAFPALNELLRGRFDAAHAGLAGADVGRSRIATEPGNAVSLLIAAWEGRRDAVTRLVPATRREARQRGDHMTLAVASLAEAVLHNGLGNYRQACTAIRKAGATDQLGVSGWALFELVEAAARSGEHVTAGRAADQLGARADAVATDWALGVQAAAQALLADDQADLLFRKAIDSLAGTGIRLHLARVQLLYGEWLRRRKRRTDARVPLREARELFAEVGADAFAERAQRELLATGEKARKRDVDTVLTLTPQESRIAHLARDGLTNADIGTRMFVSPRTVEYHLNKVFTKLGITSRTQLHLVLNSAAR